MKRLLLFAIAVSPALASCSGSGAYRWGALPLVPVDAVGMAALATTSAGELSAVGVDGIFRSEDGGLSWDQVASGAGTDVIACGDGLVAAVGAGVSRSRDGGRTWESLPPPIDSGAIRALGCGDRGAAIVAGHGDGFVQVLAGGVDHWERDVGLAAAARALGWEGDGSDGGGWTGFAASPSGEQMLALGWQGTPVFSDDGGMSWTRTQGPEGVHLEAAVFISDSTAIAVGRRDLGGPQTGGMLGGLGIGGPAVVLRSTDGGRNWSEAPTGVDRSLHDVAVTPGGELIAVGDRGTALLSTGGLAWGPIEVDGLGDLRAVAAFVHAGIDTVVATAAPAESGAGISGVRRYRKPAAREVRETQGEAPAESADARGGSGKRRPGPCSAEIDSDRFDGPDIFTMYEWGSDGLLLATRTRHSDRPEEQVIQYRRDAQGRVVEARASMDVFGARWSESFSYQGSPSSCAGLPEPPFTDCPTRRETFRGAESAGTFTYSYEQGLLTVIEKYPPDEEEPWSRTQYRYVDGRLVAAQIWARAPVGGGAGGGGFGRRRNEPPPLDHQADIRFETDAGGNVLKTVGPQIAVQDYGCWD
jgi:photosystem II stability/assembly factor-like uncharacterized protein